MHPTIFTCKKTKPSPEMHNMQLSCIINLTMGIAISFTFWPQSKKDLEQKFSWMHVNPLGWNERLHNVHMSKK